MSDYPGTGRLEPDLLAAYIDGELPPEARARVEAEIAADPENYEWLVNVITAVDDHSITGGGERSARQGEATSKGDPVPAQAQTPAPSPAPASPRGGEDTDDHKGKVVPFYRRPAVMSGFGALAVAASVLLVMQLQPEWYQRLRGPQVDPRFAKLVEAVGEERYIEARLTGGFKYGPLRPVMRGSNDRSKQNLQLLATAGELQKAAEMEPSARNLHAWGVAQILLGNPDAAAQLLAGALDPRETEFISADLAAACLSGARLTDEAAAAALRFLARSSSERLPTVEQLAQSGPQGQSARAQLAVALMTVSTEPLSLEQLFNRALALEQLGDRGRAKEAWRTYLEVEADPQWKQEAVLRLARLLQ